jgi:hypothetical protein
MMWNRLVLNKIEQQLHNLSFINLKEIVRACSESTKHTRKSAIMNNTDHYLKGKLCQVYVPVRFLVYMLFIDEKRNLLNCVYDFYVACSKTWTSLFLSSGFFLLDSLPTFSMQKIL